MTTGQQKRPAHEREYVPPHTPASGYSFVAAASLYNVIGGHCIYVKYKGGVPGRVIVKESNNSYVWYICPDRELVLVRNNQDLGAFCPWGDSFDECVDVGIFNDDVSKNLGIEYIMTNYAHTKRDDTPRVRARTDPKSRITVLSDSGGLQLSRDTSGMIHPKDLITFYNNNVDAGMCLDMPLAGTTNSELLMRAARLQKANTDIMLKHSTGAEILNIFHGRSYEYRVAFRKVVEDERISRCAIGGMYRETLLDGIRNLQAMTHEGQRYKQYHALGVFGATHIPLLVKVANSGENPPHVTSDSTSHVQSAANRAYHFQFDIAHTSKRLAIGHREGAVPSTERVLPCQCLVCRTLKYTDILAFGQGRIVTELLAIHNAYEMSRYSRQLQMACEQLPPKAFNKLVEAQLHKHAGLPEVRASLDFVDMASAGPDGMKKAMSKYGASIYRGPTWKVAAVPQMSNLFGKSVHKEAIEVAAPETLVQSEARYLKMIEAMEANIGLNVKKKKRKE